LTVNSSLVIPAAEIAFAAVRASGPGGQNVNKVSSKVELSFDAMSSPLLSLAVKARLSAIAGSALDGTGVLHVSSQLTRDQSRNLADAREKLADLLRRAIVVPKPRRKTKPSKGAQKRRLEGKRKVGEKKLARRTRSDD
jgi:ribosome-associated protein